jgi:hypothetical protein|tara:strand:- start:181 stop:597 length:417 start_codon:yes stop_codon:yes gene_type:complete
MTQIAMVDVQPKKTMEESVLNLIQFKEVSPNGNIGLERIYELVNCDSKMIERVWLGNLKNGNELHLICDEEGTFGQWNRGIKIKNQDGNEHHIFGNCLFVQSTIDGDWIGWDKEIEMADDIRKYIVPIKFFTLGSKED